MIDISKHDENIRNGKLSISYGKDGIIFTSRNFWGDESESWGKDGLKGDAGAVSMTFKNIKDAFPGINKQADADYIEMVNNSTTTGTTDGSKINPIKDYRINDQRGEFINKIKTPEDFANFSTRRIDLLNKPSFEEALLEDIRIPLDVLNNMFIDDNCERMEIGSVFAELDLNGDGFVDKGDEAMAIEMGKDALAYFESNINNMIDAIVNPNNLAFDFEASKSLLTDYYVGSEDGKIIGIDHQKYNDAFDAQVKANEVKENRNKGEYQDSMNTGVGWQLKTVIDRQIEDVIAAQNTKGAIVKNNAGFDFVSNGDGTFTNPAGDIVTSYEMLTGIHFGLEHRVRDKYSEEFPDTQSRYKGPQANQLPSQKHTAQSIFTANGKKHDASSFIGGKPMEVAGILREHFRVNTNNIYPNIKATGGKHYKDYGDVLIFDFPGHVYPLSIKTKEDVDRLMRFLNDPEWSEFIGVPVSTYES